MSAGSAGPDAVTHSTSEQAQFSSDDGETDDMLKTYPQVAALQSEPHFCNADPTRQWIKVASACLDVDGSEYKVDEEEILGYAFLRASLLRCSTQHLGYLGHHGHAVPACIFESEWTRSIWRILGLCC